MQTLCQEISSEIIFCLQDLCQKISLDFNSLGQICWDLNGNENGNDQKLGIAFVLSENIW